MAGNHPFTSAFKKTLALSGKAAKSLNHDYIGTEHLLLGIIQEGGLAAQVLNGFGIDYDRTRLEILKDLDPNFTPPKPAAHPEKSAPEINLLTRLRRFLFGHWGR